MHCNMRQLQRRCAGTVQRVSAVHRTASTGSTTTQPSVIAPPSTFDHRQATREVSLKVVAERYPELLDLVEDGTLVVVPRSKLYTERRTDGYQEPLEIFLVGTAHVSERSPANVKRIIHAVQPENVVVELCKSRSGYMYQSTETAPSAAAEATTPSSVGTSQGTAALAVPLSVNASNPFGLTGASFIGAMQRALTLGGQSGLALRIALSMATGRIMQDLKVQAGLEFVAAREAAEAVDAQIVLGDRPIDITLQRIWQQSSWQERWQLFSALLAFVASPKSTIHQLDVDRILDDDVVYALMNELGRQCPQAMVPLVHERDLYLAWSLKRSKAVNGSQRVVGVMGKGHLRGVVYALTHSPNGLRFKDLVGRSESKEQQQGHVARRLLVEGALGTLLYVAWLRFTGQ